MKNFSNFEFSNSWQVTELNLKQGERYKILLDLASISAGEIAIFLGFEDIDNHHGNFVFQKLSGQIVEISGDYSGRDHSSYLKIKNALVK
jgi:hypothetical protein